MTLPSIDSIDTYGGALNNDSPVDDPTTDRDAGAMNMALESVAQMTHTVARAWCRVVLGLTPALANPNGSDAGWGNSVPPIPAYIVTGFFTITWPATVVDELGVTTALNFRWARASLEGVTFGFTNASIATANTVSVYCGNSAGAANNLAGSTILVEVG